MIGAFKARMASEDPSVFGDEELWRDSLEGETDAIDVIRRFVRASIYYDHMGEAAEKMAASIRSRAQRFEKRKQEFRSAAFALMDLAEVSTLPEPDFLARIQQGKRGLNRASLNVDALPSEYVETKVVKTPKTAEIVEALQNGEVIDGAELTNGSRFLVIQTK
jgi:hypothetical protein